MGTYQVKAMGVAKRTMRVARDAGGHAGHTASSPTLSEENAQQENAESPHRGSTRCRVRLEHGVHALGDDAHGEQTTPQPSVAKRATGR